MQANFLDFTLNVPFHSDQIAHCANAQERRRRRSGALQSKNTLASILVDSPGEVLIHSGEGEGIAAAASFQRHQQGPRSIQAGEAGNTHLYGCTADLRALSLN